MKIADLRKQPEDILSKMTDAKEGIVDALLNITWQRVSGTGDEGNVVFGAKPSMKFVSGFLLPRFEESGEDETSDIHLSTHGLDFQVAADGSGLMTITPRFAIYIRSLPSWEEIDAEANGIFPRPPLKRAIEIAITSETRAHELGCEEISPSFTRGVDLFTDPFPSLVIQDEAHLLEESLGTFAGLFETLLEELFLRSATLLGDRVARQPFGEKRARLPKVIAATATVSVPKQQFGALYQRLHMHFPYPGTSIYRSFYAHPADASDPERREIVGDIAMAPEIKSPWMRLYVSLMTNGRTHTVTTVNVLSAYHLAITEVWQDLGNETKREPTVQRVLVVRAAEQRVKNLLASRADYFRNNKSRVFSYAIPRESQGSLAIETFHAKIVLADRDRAYIGSSNMNLASREISMECGVTLTGPCVRPVATLIDTIVSISIALA
jgi:hypothetical protein